MSKKKNVQQLPLPLPQTVAARAETRENLRRLHAFNDNLYSRLSDDLNHLTTTLCMVKQAGERIRLVLADLDGDKDDTSAEADSSKVSQGGAI